MSETQPPSQLRDATWFDNAVLDNYATDLGASGIALYMAICRCADGDGKCRDTLARLAKLAGMSLNLRRTAVTSLVELGLIAVYQRLDSSEGRVVVTITILPVSLHKHSA